MNSLEGVAATAVKREPQHRVLSAVYSLVLRKTDKPKQTFPPFPKPTDQARRGEHSYDVFSFISTFYEPGGEKRENFSLQELKNCLCVVCCARTVLSFCLTGRRPPRDSVVSFFGPYGPETQNRAQLAHTWPPRLLFLSSIPHFSVMS